MEFDDRMLSYMNDRGSWGGNHPKEYFAMLVYDQDLLSDLDQPNNMMEYLGQFESDEQALKAAEEYCLAREAHEVESGVWVDLIVLQRVGGAHSFGVNPLKPRIGK